MADPRRFWPRRVEWPTLLLLVLCYLCWGLATTWLAGVSQVLAIAVVALTACLHSSLSHEVIHGHPFRRQWLNAALVFPALSLIVPYLRFAATHRAHHRDEVITDPYDDPESNYWDPAIWARLPHWARRVLEVNNTLLGRIAIGPVIGTIGFVRLEWIALRAGDRAVARGWAWHLPALGLVIAWQVTLADITLGALLFGSYLGHSLLKIRTYLEHRAHMRARARTVVIEDRGPLALLFLNNNFHVVHHMHPQRPWYDLPGLYARRRDHYLRRNDSYVYRSYARVFLRYFCRAKDPVPHPLWRPPGQ
ncbi:fatty acid desaturase [Pseudooceanicola sediminis]|uniref:Fatty acid desaturase n=1 Tax=Pseudooceanicola sediminis TaxID=2211117 RepID=A0A399J1P4_9RHOB|nr:fatty acid desaturase [Pseudooceanicola sediminis]KAA2316331.1 fatty acid desaturase [Puniceibacterium sp. HSS470]RII39245.1 fatty acid desaturase [Pseudooceanicola sediminis]|tara:strand:+ start:27939 stop:28856 length:918 start_codon:yes stop_codon:yes gene_type:complete